MVIIRLMFNTFSKRKIVLIGIALLIVAIGTFFMREFIPSGAAAGLMASAWQATFGDSTMKEFELSASSTISDAVGQKSASLSEAAAWPSLLIDAKPPKQSPISATTATGTKVSAALKAAVEKAVMDSGAASSSFRSESEAVATPAPQWCDFRGTGQGSREVVLNEIAWMGSVRGPNDEWLEIKNISGHGLDVGGWQVLNGSGSVEIKISGDGVMASDSFLLLERGKDYSGALTNGGDHLKVFNRDCKVVDELDASSGWPAGDNAVKKTLERDADVLGWHTSENVGGSPGAQNSVPTIIISSPPATISSTVPAISVTPIVNTPAATSTQPVATTTSAIPRVVISSAQITGGDGATDHDYVEIFNPTGDSANVSGWKLRKRTQSGAESSVKVFPDGSNIPSGGYFIWANSADGFAAAIGANVSSTQILSDNNSVALLNADGIVVDALAWGSGHADPYIEGSAYPENPGANQQLKRKFEAGAVKDTGNNALDFGLLTLPRTSI